MSDTKDVDVDKRTNPAAVTIRHYRQGLGDCHLLSFPKNDGSKFRILIDCGVHTSVKGGSQKMRDIVTDVFDAVGGEPIDVLVITHEHWDHVSAFSVAKDELAKLRFRSVWMPWTEDPQDPLAQQLDDYKGKALAALGAAQDRLEGSKSHHLKDIADGIQGLMGFHFGAEGDRVRAARNHAAKSAAPARPNYLEPGRVVELPEIGARVFVLGPPRDRDLLRLAESMAEMYHLDTSRGWRDEIALSAGLAMNDFEPGAGGQRMTPFAGSVGHDLDSVLHGRADRPIMDFVGEHYAGRGVSDGQAWRRIDDDWLSVSADLALRLDRAVNNTSLVLAFEMVESGKVLLFPGDAQIGSWKSWDSVSWTGHQVTATDLLARTVYLKVAHHGSHNATPSRLGLERMSNPLLSAFVPVNKDDATKTDWHRMPFEPILDRLAERCSGRVIRADDAWLNGGKRPFAVPSGSLEDVRPTEAWVEVDLRC